MSRTLVEKIATRFAVGLSPDESARQGQIIRIRPKHVMTHDNSGAVIPKFKSIFEGAAEPRIHDPSQPVFAIDHDIQNHTPENLAKYTRIATFAREHNIDFYPAGTGISHQVMVEQGYAIPGSLVVGSDSHSNMYGGVGALGTPVVRTDAACIWATGQTWWQVPKVARCELTGALKPGVVGKDVIIALCGLFRNDEVLNCAVEFTGEGIASMTMDHRLSIANMTTEWGALAGLFPFDQRLKDYLLERAAALSAARRPGERPEPSLGSYTASDVESWWDERIEADDDASYAVELTLDLSSITPHVCGPNNVKTMMSAAEMESRRVAIHKAYLVSCVNARLADLTEAAAVVKGKKIADGVSFYVAAASAEIQAKAEADGSWSALLDAGATPLPSGCGPCIGLGTGLVEDGEVAISATNRNFKGRMGSREAEVYLASPAVVAASAVAGYIRAPGETNGSAPIGRVLADESSATTSNGAQAQSATGDVVKILDGFPATVSGRALYLPQDNLNTDGIYAGKWTYKDDLTTEQMAAVTFENYDAGFNELYKQGDIVVGGRNFGTGSSREQAATALKHKGVPCVIAASYSETYRRNAFNNGFLCIECAAFVDAIARDEAVATQADAGDLTIPVGEIEIDFRRSVVRRGDKSFAFTPLSPVAQELVAAGGAEAIARATIGGVLAGPSVGD
jgi:homoaconitate hydratase